MQAKILRIAGDEQTRRVTTLPRERAGGWWVPAAKGPDGITLAQAWVFDVSLRGLEGRGWQGCTLRRPGKADPRSDAIPLIVGAFGGTGSWDEGARRVDCGAFAGEGDFR